MAEMTRVEWSTTKAVSNRRKHGIAFDDAIEAFYDPHVVVEQDRTVGGEARWQTLGMVAGVVLLLVAHTVEAEDEDEVIRIISARRADRKERRRYEQNRSQSLG
jgi:uncharacterized DUF497 family protein